MIKFLLLSLPAILFVYSHSPTRLDEANTPAREDLTSFSRVLETKSNFIEKEIVKTQRLKFKTQYLENPEKETDYEIVIKKGVVGERKEILALTSWWKKPAGEVLKKVEIRPAQNEIIEKGTKVTWKEVDLNGTKLRYWKKLNVWATSYDAHCRGCSGRTWAGTDVSLGTCAVDPKVIALGSRFYVPGYGLCSALDIGGGIKGKKVDLGFPDVKQGFWSARFVDVYFLDGQPS